MAQGLDIKELLKQSFHFDSIDPDRLTPLDLAFIGDAVTTLIFRVVASAGGAARVEKLHQQTKQFVSAGAQSEMMRYMQPHLTEKEHTIYRRARNQKPGSHAKNQSVTDYRRATGYEALIGYLYLSGETDRLVELLQIGYQGMTDSEGETDGSQA